MMMTKHIHFMKSLCYFTVLLAVVVTGSAIKSFAADGDLDPSFGGTGKTHVAFANVGFAIGTTDAVQPDGKILVAGVVADMNAD